MDDRVILGALLRFAQDGAGGDRPLIARPDDYALEIGVRWRDRVVGGEVSLLPGGPLLETDRIDHLTHCSLEETIALKVNVVAGIECGNLFVETGVPLRPLAGLNAVLVVDLHQLRLIGHQASCFLTSSRKARVSPLRSVRRRSPII